MIDKTNLQFLLEENNWLQQVLNQKKIICKQEPIKWLSKFTFVMMDRNCVFVYLTKESGITCVNNCHA